MNLDSPNSANLMASAMFCRFFSKEAWMALMTELRITIGAKNAKAMSLKDVENFFWMSSICLPKDTVADLALSMACGTSEVVLMFTVRS